MIRDHFGSDRLAWLLLWEIARLRSVVMVLYRYIRSRAEGRVMDDEDADAVEG